MALSKTQQALEWLRQNPGKTAYAAAKQFDLSASTVTRALKVQKETAGERCPTCGQLIRK